MRLYLFIGFPPGNPRSNQCSGAMLDFDESFLLQSPVSELLTVLRLTPKSAATWRTGGNDEPSGNSPAAISPLISSTTWLIERASVSFVNRDVHIVC